MDIQAMKDQVQEYIDQAEIELAQLRAERDLPNDVLKRRIQARMRDEYVPPLDIRVNVTDEGVQATPASNSIPDNVVNLFKS